MGCLSRPDFGGQVTVKSRFGVFTKSGADSGELRLESIRISLVKHQHTEPLMSGAV